MIMEIFITLEIVAFIFMIFGLIPFSKKGDSTREENLPLMNKILFLGVGAVIFFALGLMSNAYDYNYCYINETVANFATNSTTSTATCAPYVIYNPEMSYLNLFLGMVSVVLMIIVGFIASLSLKASRNFEGGE